MPVSTVEEIVAALASARAEHLPVAIAGKRHSMGGQAFAPGAVVLDMTGFARVLAADAAARTVTVESGATWEAVIRAANAHGLAVEVMQAYSGFTVAGSLAVNVHESDPRFGPLVESVRSFRLLLADGSIVRVSRRENPGLFGLVIGGYGLFGVILDVELSLTDDKVYRKSERLVDYREIAAAIAADRADPAVENVFARLSIVPGRRLLRQTVATTYRATTLAREPYAAVAPPRHTALKRFLFGLSRRYGWGKRFRWWLQRAHGDRFEPPLISRNNLMNVDFGCLRYGARQSTDILQEYFLPTCPTGRTRRASNSAGRTRGRTRSPRPSCATTPTSGW
ncbi:MAG TPA: FAD-binding oxidoreductase [Thermoanaerobaculia bacterium]|nr:FAD-binding oxidoreductase [Thermoanaerobaculia bacterium]